MLDFLYTLFHLIIQKSYKVDVLAFQVKKLILKEVKELVNSLKGWKRDLADTKYII